MQAAMLAEEDVRKTARKDKYMKKDIHLITLVERFSHLYDKKDVKYKDRTAVENSWQFISGELQIPVADCINRWLALRNRFSKERAKTPSSGSALQTEWSLMKYLAFLHPVVKKRRTFGNIKTEDELNSPWEMQKFDFYKENNNVCALQSQKIEENDSIKYTDYEYLDEETGSVIDLPTSTEDSSKSVSNFSNKNNTLELIRQIRPITSDTSENRPLFNTYTVQRPATSNTSQRSTIKNTSTLQRPTTPNTFTSQRPTTPNTSIPQKSTTPNTSTQRPTTPNTSTPQRSITPNTSTPQRSTTPNTSDPERFKSKKRKQSLDVEDQLGDAVDIFKSFITQKNTVNAVDDSLKYFCDSLYGDLKNLSKKDLITCKIEILQVISKYTQ